MEIQIGESRRYLNLIDIAEKNQEIKDELICSICSCVMVNPHGYCKNHSFCKDCIINWLDKQSLDNGKGSKTCPICRTTIPEFLNDYLLTLDVELEEKINKIKIHCPYSFKDDTFRELDENGCKEIITGDGFYKHIKECPYVFTVCENSIKSKNNRCGIKRLLELSDHYLLDCPYVVDSCLLCNKPYKRGNRDLHNSRCVNFLLNCENGCQEKFKRSEIQIHIEDCPNQLIDCPYKSYGCNDSIKKSEKESHSTLYNNHNIFLLNRIDTLSNQLSKFQELFKEQTFNIENLIKHNFKEVVEFQHMGLIDSNTYEKKSCKLYFTSEYLFKVHLIISKYYKYSKLKIEIKIDNMVILVLKDIQVNKVFEKTITLPPFCKTSDLVTTTVKLYKKIK